MGDVEKTVGGSLPEKKIAGLSSQQILQLVQENARLKQELRIRDNDILSHDQVFDAIVSGTLHVILVMSVTDYTAEFVTSNVETAFGISRAEVMENVRRLGFSFENIEEYNGKEEIYIHRTNGTRRQYLIYVIHLPYGRSDRVAVVLLCRSSVAKGDLEEMMLQQTQDINRAAGYFLSSLSHDFHVPVNTISGFVMLLMKNSKNPDKVREYAHNIGQACQEILSTIDQIIDMSRIEATDIVIESEEFGLGLMLQEISTIMLSLARARDQEYLFEAEGIEHDIVIGDRERLMELLRLLLTNSVKYTPPGGRVSLHVSAVPDETNERVSLLFEVQDTGIGMEPEQMRRYFQDEIPDAPGEKPGRGTGIWLARKLIAMMGGTMTAQSRPGEGTTVWIRMRLEMVNDGMSDFWSRHGIRRVLIVDRNIQEASRIRNLLESAGISAMSASSGFGTIKMVEQSAAVDQAYDLILLDDSLVDMSWQEVVTSIEKMDWGQMSSIFLMTGHRLRDEERQGIENLYTMSKPFYFSAFHRMVEKVCGNRLVDGGSREEELENTLSGMRFLVAEDHMINAKRLKDQLEISGARCEIAGNGRAALAMFSNSRPGNYDAILMDIQMPVMGGYASAAAIRGLARDDAGTIPIIAMIANSMEFDENRISEAGIDASISKPLEIRTLQNHLRRILNKKSGK